MQYTQDYQTALRVILDTHHQLQVEVFTNHLIALRIFQVDLIIAAGQHVGWG